MPEAAAPFIHDIDTRVRSIVAEELCRPIETVTLATALAEMNADSLDRVAITDQLGLEFDVVIQDSEVEDIETVGDLARLVKRKVVGKTQRS